MQRNAFSSKDAFSDAPIENDVLNFLESQRLRSDILTRERHNYYEKRKAPLFRRALSVRETFLYSCVDFNFATASCVATSEPMQKKENILSISRDPFSINSPNKIFLQTFSRKRRSIKIDNVENFYWRTFPRIYIAACFWEKRKLQCISQSSFLNIAEKHILRSYRSKETWQQIVS